MSWTDERVELLKKMWAEGRSASQIAKELGSVTRNAVIGKVHRLGLASRVAGDGEAAKSAPAAEVSAGAEAAQPAPAEAAEGPVVEMTAEGGAAPAEAAREMPETPGRAEPARDAAGPVADGAAGEAPGGGTDGGAGETAPPAGGTVVTLPNRRPIVPAGQPLPPQPSANEISPEALANVREIEKGARKLTLMELTERTCKWPIGDPATDEFWFCGLPVAPGKPYCEAHVSVAFQPMQARRDRRR